MATKKSPAADSEKSNAATTPKSKGSAAKVAKSATGSKSNKTQSKKSTDAAAYTKPELRERLKDKIKEGDKGGKPGQWSARKAQLLASEYEKEGGGYEQGGRSDGQKHLQSWTKEKWQTADGEKAIQGNTTSRYLPKKAWDKLTPAQKRATDNKKKTASHTGKQFVANTRAAKSARKAATKD